MKFCRGWLTIGGKRMSDLIDRQAAISYAISGRIRTLPTSEDGENWIRTSEVRQSLLTMPSAQPEVLDTNVGKWIPCDKGKPDPYRRVLMTERRPDWNGKEYYIVTLDSFCNHRGDVVAWMPLPEPYKGD